MEKNEIDYRKWNTKYKDLLYTVQANFSGTDNEIDIKDFLKNFNEVIMETGLSEKGAKTAMRKFLRKDARELYDNYTEHDQNITLQKLYRILEDNYGKYIGKEEANRKIRTLMEKPISDIDKFLKKLLELSMTAQNPGPNSKNLGFETAVNHLMIYIEEKYPQISDTLETNMQLNGKGLNWAEKFHYIKMFLKRRENKIVHQQHFKVQNVEGQEEENNSELLKTITEKIHKIEKMVVNQKEEQPNSWYQQKQHWNDNNNWYNPNRNQNGFQGPKQGTGADENSPVLKNIRINSYGKPQIDYRDYRKNTMFRNGSYRQNNNPYYKQTRPEYYANKQEKNDREIIDTKKGSQVTRLGILREILVKHFQYACYLCGKTGHNWRNCKDYENQRPSSTLCQSCLTRGEYRLHSTCQYVKVENVFCGQNNSEPEEYDIITTEYNDPDDYNSYLSECQDLVFIRVDSICSESKKSRFREITAGILEYFVCLLQFILEIINATELNNEDDDEKEYEKEFRTEAINSMDNDARLRLDIGGRPHIYGTVNDFKIKILFDTGSSVCLIYKYVLESIPNYEEFVEVTKYPKIFDHQDKEIAIDRAVLLPLKIAGETFHISFLVSSINKSCILGSEFLYNKKLTFHGMETVHKSIKLQVSSIQDHKNILENKDDGYPPYIAETLVLPGESSRKLKTTIFPDLCYGKIYFDKDFQSSVEMEVNFVSPHHSITINNNISDITSEGLLTFFIQNGHSIDFELYTGSIIGKAYIIPKGSSLKEKEKLTKKYIEKNMKITQEMVEKYTGKNIEGDVEKEKERTIHTAT